MDPFYISIIAGVVFGIIISLVFKISSTKDASSLSYKLFGIPIVDIISNIAVFGIISSVIFLSTISVFVKDLYYPTHYSYLFAIETLLMAFLPAIVLLFMCVFRGYSITSSVLIDFVIFAAHFGILHILFQFSGYYSYLFPPK